MAKKNNGNPVVIDTVKHKDKRTNIPTEELKRFAKEKDLEPVKVEYPGLLYARDPSLDPQLVWKGKDEQDKNPLTVTAVPIFIQEKIHPQAIIEDIRKQAKKEKIEQMDFFSDFNGIKFEEQIDFYRHEQNWQNRMILGDSLMVMSSLAEKEGLKGKVQMIYIDPPYGINFGSNWQVSTRKRDVKDGKADDATRQPEQIKAFRDTWKLGIHSYLSYLRDRLILSRELLTESGSIFVQIGDENVHLVRCLMDEVFGAENFVSMIPFRKTVGATSILLPVVNDFILWYAENKERVKFRKILREKDIYQRDIKFSWYEEITNILEKLKEDDKDPKKIIALDDMTSQDPSATGNFITKFEGKSYSAAGNRHWRTTEIGVKRLINKDRIYSNGNKILFKRYLSDQLFSEENNFWFDTVNSFENKTYVVQTNTTVIQRCLLMTTDPGDLVLDPTCGSGTTAYVAEQWGRRWVTLDTSRVAMALARTRLMSAKYPYYLLADSPEGIKKEADNTGKVPPDYKTENDIKRGFVYKRVPHITLKSIANNEEIDVIYGKWQGKMEPLRVELNKLLKQKWEEWEIPRDAEDKWPVNVKKLHAKWWEYRRNRQKEIDDSVARRADMELLYDQPYEDNKRIRVTGPFTVESLSPHRQMSMEEKKKRIEGTSDAHPGFSVRTMGAGQFENIILDYLKKSGIQNTYKNERLKLDSLDYYPGEWIQASGTYQSDGKTETKKIAICIGPEYGTVGTDLIKEAAKEAVKGLGFDTLAICGFAFDPGVYSEAKDYGKLTLLMVKMNPDLSMGDELLKKTGAGNLFMVFGEPDITIQKLQNNKIQVEIKGLDIYDPTTGEIRSASTDEIACWFIDTDYNGESFFVRHAYFTGADEPYEKLKRALKAEIDVSAWESVYSTVSRPFSIPDTGKIAVKVINHYGDEVLRVYKV